MNNTDNKIRAWIERLNPDALFLNYKYDEALIGYSSNNNPVYDLSILLAILMQTKSRKDAEIEISYLTHEFDGYADVCPIFVNLLDDYDIENDD